MGECNIAQLLKERTSDVHKRLHVHPLLACLTNGCLTEVYYSCILQAFYNFSVALQFKVKRLGVNCPLLTQDIGLLEKDLAQLSRAFVSVAPPSEILPTIEHYDQYIGLRYVMQGSHLGGLVIARHVSEVLCLSPSTGVAFYTGGGKNTASSWRSFLLDCEEQYQDKARTLDAAVSTFTALEAYLWKVWSELQGSLSKS